MMSSTREVDQVLGDKDVFLLTEKTSVCILMTSWLTENKPKFTQRVKLILCLDSHTCPLKQAVCFSPSQCRGAYQAPSWSLKARDWWSFLGKQEDVAPVEFHAHKGLASFLNNGQRQSTRWNLVPWLWALKRNRSQLYHWTDKGCLGWWVGAELGSDWGLQGGPSWGRWGCIVSIKPGAYWSGWLESLPRHRGN